ncbi:MAG: YDG domain-containing protein [Clostridiales bacterium]|jgi:hypothetical protein|nr:YDG domain-containing protein [Clostridiales bacterium]
MAFTARTVKDRVAVGDGIFTIEDLGGGKVKLTPAPTSITEVGTPIDKAYLQPIEDYLGNLGTAAEKNVGTENGNVPILDENGKLPSNIMSDFLSENVFIDVPNGLVSNANPDGVSTVQEALTYIAGVLLQIRTITVTGIKAVNKAFDASNVITIDKSEMVISGALYGDNVTISVSSTGTTADANVGVAKPVTYTKTVSGTDAIKYRVVFPNLTVTISAT